MNLADVYPKYPATIVKGEGCYIWDAEGRQIMDFYSGHGVISIGHQHPRFVYRLKKQLESIVYYSNAVHLQEQVELAQKLGALSGHDDDQLFLVNSGAEAVENALKVASFTNGRKQIIAFRRAFHGRTDLAVQCSDSPKLCAPINQGADVVWLDLNDEEGLRQSLNDQTCAVIVEGIQGIGGIHEPQSAFLQLIQTLCEKHGAFFIADEIQSGFGRSGQFFAHQLSGVKPDMITMAKGMGNGFPIGGVIINSAIPLKNGMLGTTFGGSPLACAAALAVVETIQEENLMGKAFEHGAWLIDHIRKLPQVKEVRGRGMMIGIDFPFATAKLRSILFHKFHIIVGSASTEETIRLLPPLTAGANECRRFLECLEEALQEHEEQR